MPLRLDRQIVMRASALLAGSALVGLGVNAARPGGVALRSFEAPSTCTSEAQDQAPIVELGPREALALCGQGGAVFADTRPPSRFAAGHVVDALHLPCDASASGAEVALRELSNASMVVVYGDATDDARAVAETLRRRGLKADVRVLSGGFAAWEKEGLACASGPCAHCVATSSSR